MAVQCGIKTCGRAPPGLTCHMTELPVEIYGISLLVRLVDENNAGIHLHCPRGGTVLYGQVIRRGDGFDADGHVFRPMPHLDAIVGFEENPEEPRGYSFVAAGDEYRLITVDDILMAWSSGNM